MSTLSLDDLDAATRRTLGLSATPRCAGRIAPDVVCRLPVAAVLGPPAASVAHRGLHHPDHAGPDDGFKLAAIEIIETRNKQLVLSFRT